MSVATALDAAGDLRPYLSSKVQGIDDGLAAKDGVEKVMGQTMPKPAEKVAAVACWQVLFCQTSEPQVKRAADSPHHVCFFMRGGQSRSRSWND